MGRGPGAVSYGDAGIRTVRRNASPSPFTGFSSQSPQSGHLNLQFPMVGIWFV